MTAGAMYVAVGALPQLQSVEQLMRVEAGGISPHRFHYRR